MQIKQYSVSWQKHFQHKTIGNDHLKVISEYDRASIDRQKAILDDPTDGPLVAEALALVLKKMDYSHVDDLMYALVMIDEILAEDRKYAQLFRELSQVSIFKNILDLMSWDKKFSTTGAHVLGVLFYPGLGHGAPIIDKHLDDLVESCLMELAPEECNSGNCRKMIDMLGCFIVILREDTIRKTVNEKFRLHGHFSRLLEKAFEMNDVQLLYQVGFCLWLLSFDGEIAEKKMTSTNVVMNILKVIKSVSREKVIRVCMACLRNLVDKADHSQMMIENDAMKLLAVLRNRKWTDEEVKEDLDFVFDSLAKSVHILSSIEMYQKELYSGKLEWTPVHKSETFWRENVTKLCPAGKLASADLTGMTELLKSLDSKGRLGSLDTEETTTLAVICHDLGEFARFHPNGKKILQCDAHEDSSGSDGKPRSTKDILMGIMSNPPNQSDEIGKQALTCIHKMMVTNWQFLEPK